MKLRWIGGPTFTLEFGCFTVLCDPVLGEGDAVFSLDPVHVAPGANAAVARLAPLAPLDLGRADLLLLGNAGPAHIDAAAADQLDKNLPVIAPPAAADTLASYGFTRVRGLEPGSETTETREGQALSVCAVPTRAGDTAHGRAYNGYVLRHSVAGEPYTVCWPGDTLWFPESREIKERIGAVDLLILHIGAVGRGSSGGRTTLDAKDAMQFVFMFQPKRIVPVGHHTFSHYTESIDAFTERIALTMYDRRLVVLREGEVFEHAAS